MKRLGTGVFRGSKKKGLPSGAPSFCRRFATRFGVCNLFELLLHAYLQELQTIACKDTQGGVNVASAGYPHLL